jgi:hypothetical protein
MSKSQQSSQIAAKQMFADNSFWDEVDAHLAKLQPETLDNARVKPITDQSSGIADAVISSAD